MIDCKECGKTFEKEEYKACPYCGQVPEDEAKGDPGAGKPAEYKAAPEEKVKKTDDPEGPEVKKAAGSKLKIFLIALLVLAVIAVAVSLFFTLDDTGITVPDKYSTIQEAIDAAEDGDIIVVDIGVYRENIDFRGKNITLTSLDPDDPDTVERTIIDGRGSGTVVSFRSGETEEAKITGFTVTRGSGILVSGNSSPVIEKCVIEDNNAEFGAGIAVFDSSPTIRENVIIGNSGFLGGGLFIEESSPLVEGNLIVSNRAEMGSGMVIISNSSPTVRNNQIVENRAQRLGGGIVVAVDSTPLIQDNVITGNYAERNGGGILIEESEPVLEDNEISRNRAANGGGIFIVNSFTAGLRIIGNEIINNLAFVAGGGIFMEGSSPVIEDNSFTGNISEALGGGIAVYNSAPVVRRNIFEDNEAENPDGGGAIWVSEDSELGIGDPDDNGYVSNIPGDLFFE